MKIGLERKIFITLILFALGILVIIIAIIIPSARMLLTLRDRGAAARLDLEQHHTEPVNVRSLIQDIKTLRITTSQYPSHLFKAGDELKLITALEKVAAQTAVNQKIENSNFDAITNQKASVSLAVTGHYQNVLHYLESVENLPYFIIPEQITFSPREAGDAASKDTEVSLHLVLSVYVNP